MLGLKIWLKNIMLVLVNECEKPNQNKETQLKSSVDEKIYTMKL